MTEKLSSTVIDWKEVVPPKQKQPLPGYNPEERKEFVQSQKVMSLEDVKKAQDESEMKQKKKNKRKKKKKVED